MLVVVVVRNAVVEGHVCTITALAARMNAPYISSMHYAQCTMQHVRTMQYASHLCPMPLRSMYATQQYASQPGTMPNQALCHFAAFTHFASQPCI